MAQTVRLEGGDESPRREPKAGDIVRWTGMADQVYLVGKSHDFHGLKWTNLKNGAVCTPGDWSDERWQILPLGSTVRLEV